MCISCIDSIPVMCIVILSVTLYSLLHRVSLVSLFCSIERLLSPDQIPSIIPGNQISAFVEVFIPRVYGHSGSFQHR